MKKKLLTKKMWLATDQNNCGETRAFLSKIKSDMKK